MTTRCLSDLWWNPKAVIPKTQIDANEKWAEALGAATGTFLAVVVYRENWAAYRSSWAAHLRSKTQQQSDSELACAV